MAGHGQSALERFRKAARSKVGSMLPPDIRASFRRRFPLNGPPVGYIPTRNVAPVMGLCIRYNEYEMAPSP